MKNHLSLTALILALTALPALAVVDAKTYVVECGASQKVLNADGSVSRITLAEKQIEISEGGSLDLSFQVINGNQPEEVALHADTMVMNIPDFPKPGDVLTNGSMNFVLTFKKDGRTFSTLSNSRKTIPLIETGLNFIVGSNHYGAGCTVTDKVNKAN